MKNIEENIKNRIDNYGSEIDPSEIWVGIQNKMYPKKKRRFLFYWIAASIIILFSLSLVLYIESKPKQRIFITKTKVKPILDKENKIIKNNFNSEPISNKNNHKIHQENETLSNDISDKLIKDKNIEYTNINFNRNENSVNLKSHLPNKSFQKFNPSINEIKNNESKVKNYKANGKNKSIVISHINNIKTLNIDKFLLFPKLSSIKSKEKNNSNTKLSSYFDFSITPNYVFNKYSLSDSKSTDFYNNVKNNEVFLEAFDITVGYNQNVFRNIGIYTGINYGQIDSKLEYSFKEIKKVELDSTLSKIIINSVQDSLRIYERVKTNANYITKVISFKYQRYLRIPLLLTFTSKFSKVHYEIRTGIDFNILKINKGKTILPNGKVSDINDTDTNLLRNKLIGDFHLDLKIDYNLTPKLTLSLGPQYKVNIRSLMNKNAGFNHFQHKVGFNIGLKYVY